MVPSCERCTAKRANGEQCTRRKKDDTSVYCGTHNKGTPHGIVDSTSDQISSAQKVELWVEDIQGIMWYIDKDHNVYQTEDIVSNNMNPKIITKCVKHSDGTYSIPNYNI